MHFMELVLRKVRCVSVKTVTNAGTASLGGGGGGGGGFTPPHFFKEKNNIFSKRFQFVTIKFFVFFVFFRTTKKKESE